MLESGIKMDWFGVGIGIPWIAGLMDWTFHEISLFVGPSHAPPERECGNMAPWTSCSDRFERSKQRKVNQLLQPELSFLGKRVTLQRNLIDEIEADEEEHILTMPDSDANQFLKSLFMPVQWFSAKRVVVFFIRYPASRSGDVLTVPVLLNTVTLPIDLPYCFNQHANKH